MTSAQDSKRFIVKRWLGFTVGFRRLSADRMIPSAWPSVGSEPVPFRQDLGLAKKNNRRNNDTIATSPKTIEATG